MEKQKQTKSPVKLRVKELSDGSRSLYLDIYLNGKRKYKFLQMYLKPDIPKNKQYNKSIWMAAEKVKADYVIKLTNDAAGVFADDDKRTLGEWLDEYAMEKLKSGQSQSRSRIIKAMKETIDFYCPMQLAKIKEDTIKDIIETINATGLKQNTKHIYLAALKSAFKTAVKRKVLNVNPFDYVDERISTEEVEKEYLTPDELKALEIATCPTDDIKRAFLLSACCCGLRFSDLRTLKYSDIKDGFLVKKMVKTRVTVSIPLTDRALRYIGNGEPDELIFNLKENNQVNRHVVRWMKNAGITKHITMHCARHSFAVNLITAGVDLYTVSKLLGHTDITTTQVYAKIVDSKKVSAVEMLNKFLK